MPGGNPALASELPAGVQAVPRSRLAVHYQYFSNTYDSLEAFGFSDVISGAKLAGTVPLTKFEVLWLQ